MFNFSEDLKEVNVIIPNKEKRKVDGCTLIEVKRDKESQAMLFTWKEERTGATLTRREFLPKKGDASDETWKKGVHLSASCIAHIARAYMTDEEYASLRVKGDSKSLVEKVVQENWLEITRQIGPILIKKLGTDAVKNSSLKVVYTENKGKWYSGLPKVPPFISTPNHPKDFSYDPKYDKFEIPQRGAGHTPDSELPPQGSDSTNAFSNSGGAASSDDDF